MTLLVQVDSLLGGWVPVTWKQHATYAAAEWELESLRRDRSGDYRIIPV